MNEKKTTPGRPRLSPAVENPTVRIGLKVTAAQRLTLRRVAHDRGVGISTVVREAIDRFDPDHE